MNRPTLESASLASICLVAVLAMARPASADEPPSWQPFETCSANGRFCARVEPVGGSPQTPWEAKYILRVVDGEGSGVWSSPYAYDGYAGGHLSDDGAYFVYVDFWYSHDHPVVTIYSKETRRSLAGSEFAIPEGALVRTVSHRIWLHQERTPVAFRDPSHLSIVTIDGRTHTIHLPTGTLDHE